VSRDFREEHRLALDWLNRGHASTDFFGVVVELLQVDSSKPAANLRLIAIPNDWSRRSTPAARSSELSTKQERYLQFFQQLIDDLREKHRFTNARAGQPQNWYSFSSGHRGFTYGVSFANGGRVRAELYLDTGDAEENRATFETFKADAAEIEHELDAPPEWEALDGKRACRIALYRDGAIEDPEEKLEEYRNWAVEQVLKLTRVFDPRLQARESGKAG
jgi:hypothetical protein